MNSFSTALTAIRRSPYQAFLSIVMLSVTFYVAYTFALFLLAANTVLEYFETRPQIIAFFELDAEQNVINSLEENMLAKDYVQDVSVITKDEALEIYTRENRNDPLLLELVTADILPASIEVSATDITALPQIREDLQSAPGIEDVIYQEDIVNALQSWTSSLRIIGFISLGIIGGISYLIITILIAIKVASKKNAIAIMRIIGATRWYIEAPFMIEGMLYGMIGSLIGWVGMYISLLYLTPWLTEFLGEVSLLPISVEFFALKITVGTLIGIFLGGTAGFMAVRRLIRL